ncbi:MAG: hypothetical protein KBT20_00875 [Bacteroidales bacterium]|nr:hypothetical protein [Candidatus Liminaster caballi]
MRYVHDYTLCSNVISELYDLAQQLRQDFHTADVATRLDEIRDHLDQYRNARNPVKDETAGAYNLKYDADKNIEFLEQTISALDAMRGPVKICITSDNDVALTIEDNDWASLLCVDLANQCDTYLEQARENYDRDIDFEKAQAGDD